MRLEIISLIFTSVALSAGSQIILKLGMTQEQMQESLASGDRLRIAIAIATSPLVVSGFVCFGLSAVIWLFVLSRTPLSSAYPFVALGIVVTVIAGRLTFGEPLTIAKLAGVGLIATGILLVGLNG